MKTLNKKWEKTIVNYTVNPCLDTEAAMLDAWKDAKNWITGKNRVLKIDKDEYIYLHWWTHTALEVNHRTYMMV